MEERTEETKKTFLNDELDNGYSIEVVVDHLDDEQPFEINFGVNMDWSSRSDLLKLKKMINKALRIK